MADIQWVHKGENSSHIVSLFSDRVGRTHTLCGRMLGGMSSDDIVTIDQTLGVRRSCESCLRIQARRADQP